MTTDAPTKPAKRERRSTARPPTANELFLASALGEETVVSRSVGSDGSVATFTHKGSKLVVLYRPTTWGWESVQVPSPNVSMLLRSGMRPTCGDCDGDCSPDPMAPTPNACPGRDKFSTRRCPICTKTVYDFSSRIVHPDAAIPMADEEENEGTEINDGAYTLATPAARTKTVLDQHILAYHPADAASLGLGTPDPRLVNPARGPAEAARR